MKLKTLLVSVVVTGAAIAAAVVGSAAHAYTGGWQYIDTSTDQQTSVYTMPNVVHDSATTRRLWMKMIDTDPSVAWSSAVIYTQVNCVGRAVRAFQVTTYDQNGDVIQGSGLRLSDWTIANPGSLWSEVVDYACER